MPKEMKGPCVYEESRTRTQTEYPAEVGIDLTTGEVFAEGVKRTRVREVPQPDVVIDGGVTKDQPAQPIDGF